MWLSWEIPEEIGLAHVCVFPDDRWSGIAENYSAIGEAAVEKCH